MDFIVKQINDYKRDICVDLSDSWTDIVDEDLWCLYTNGEPHGPPTDMEIVVANEVQTCIDLLRGDT